MQAKGGTAKSIGITDQQAPVYRTIRRLPNFWPALQS